MNNSQRSSQRKDDLSEEQMAAAVLKVTTFLLCDMRSKRKVRKEDIVTNALDKSSRQYAAIMKRVKSNLLNVCGLQLVKLPDSEDAFIIVNKHRIEFSKLTFELSTDRENQENLILTVVLSSIFMNRGHMFESHVMTILEEIGFLTDKFYGPPPEYIKMKDYVTKLVNNLFVKQMYLEAKSVDRPEQEQNPPLADNGKKNVIVFYWGFRALVEVDVDKIVDYLVKIHDGRKPAAFPAVYYKELKTKQALIQAQLQ